MGAGGAQAFVPSTPAAAQTLWLNKRGQAGLWEAPRCQGSVNHNSMSSLRDSSSSAHSECSTHPRLKQMPRRPCKGSQVPLSSWLKYFYFKEMNWLPATEAGEGGHWSALCPQSGFWCVLRLGRLKLSESCAITKTNRDRDGCTMPNQQLWVAGLQILRPNSQACKCKHYWKRRKIFFFFPVTLRGGKESLQEERAGTGLLRICSCSVWQCWDLCLSLLSKCSHLPDKRYPLQEVLSFLTNGVFISGK